MLSKATFIHLGFSQTWGSPKHKMHNASSSNEETCGARVRGENPESERKGRKTPAQVLKLLEISGILMYLSWIQLKRLRNILVVNHKPDISLRPNPHHQPHSQAYSMVGSFPSRKPANSLTYSSQPFIIGKPQSLRKQKLDSLNLQLFYHLSQWQGDITQFHIPQNRLKGWSVGWCQAENGYQSTMR